MVANNRFVFGRWLDLFPYSLSRRWSPNYSTAYLILSDGSNGSLTTDRTWWEMLLACESVVWASGGFFLFSIATSCGAFCGSCWMKGNFCLSTAYEPFRNTTAITRTLWMLMALLTASTTSQRSRVPDFSAGIQIGVG